jgi:hypothetical protein
MQGHDEDIVTRNDLCVESLFREGKSSVYVAQLKLFVLSFRQSECQLV